MSTPVHAEDREHFFIVRQSLARDGLHVAMVAHDRKRLQEYAGSLARALAGQDGLRVEAYDPRRLESVVVDLMLHRFDAALSDISIPSRSQSGGLPASACRSGCVLFIPEAQSLPRAEFRQLLRVAAGTRRNGLRLVALFDADSPACDERIAEMGAQVARWDIDDEADGDRERASGPWRRGSDARAARSGAAIPTASPFPASCLPSKPRIPFMPAMYRITGSARSLARNGNRWLAVACAAAMLALLPALLPLSGDGSTLSPSAGHTVTDTVTRSGMVELAGVPRQDFARAPAADDDLLAEHDTLPASAGNELPASNGVNAQDATRASTTEAAAR